MHDETNDERAPRRGSRPADPHASSHGEHFAGDDDDPGQSLLKSLDAIDEDQLARALGWFSVALGVAEVVAPRQLGRALGVEPNANLVRAVGLREIASGVGILTGRQRAGWLWSRVAGDAMDLALLGAAIGTGSGNRTRVAAATAAVAGVTALDVYVSRRMEQRDQAESAREADLPATGTDGVTSAGSRPVS